MTTQTTIIQGDSVALMREMAEGCVDLVVTDPPYRVITGGNSTDPNKRHGKVSGLLKADAGESFTGKNLHGDICDPETYLPELFRVMRDPSHAYIFTNFLNLERVFAAARGAGFEVHNLLVWKKPNTVPNRWYMKNCEFVVMLRKGRAFSINDCGSKMCHEFDSVKSKDKRHAAEKPIDLLKHYIENSSSEGDLVFDPFAGSFSTGEACQKINRQFLGIEKNPKHILTGSIRLKVLPSMHLSQTYLRNSSTGVSRLMA